MRKTCIKRKRTWLVTRAPFKKKEMKTSDRQAVLSHIGRRRWSRWSRGLRLPQEIQEESYAAGGRMKTACLLSRGLPGVQDSPVPLTAPKLRAAGSLALSPANVLQGLLIDLGGVPTIYLGCAVRTRRGRARTLTRRMVPFRGQLACSPGVANFSSNFVFFVSHCAPRPRAIRGCSRILVGPILRIFL